MVHKFLLLFASLSLTLSCTSAEPVSGQSAGAVLFIGNSYTYTNDLPSMVAALAESVGVKLDVESVTFGGVSLEDHWNEGTARRRLRERQFDIVVLQQGPSSLPESRVNLLQYATLFNGEIRSAGARPAFYSVWPDADRMEAYPAARESYALAADSLDGMLFPASEAWLAAWRRTASLGLYGPDRLHPSKVGTFLVATLIVSQLTGKPASDLPNGVTVGAGDTTLVSPGVGDILRQAAAEAIAGFGRK